MIDRIARRLRRLFRPRRRLRLTRDGRFFIAITIGIGLAAINTGNNLLYLVLGWMLSMIIASGLLSDLTMRGLEVTRRSPRRIFARRPFLMEIAVENLKDGFASYSIEIEDLVNDKALDKRCYFLKIPAERTQKTSYRHTFGRRGLYKFSGFRIATKFPFALFHKSRRIDVGGEVVVYPPVEPIALPPPAAKRTGETATNMPGRRGEFFGLREYRDGDDRRSIHWRSSARTGHLLIREYERESQRRASVFVDNALPAAPTPAQANALERAITTAASLAAAYLRSGFAVRVVARGEAVKFGAGEAQLDRVLRLLALLPTVSADDPPAFFERPAPMGQNVLVVPHGVGCIDRPTGLALYEGPR